jgi:hypothetical protein
MSFDAGSIEATLKLNREQFQRDLAAAKQAGADFDGKDFTAEVKVDGTAEVESEFASMDAMYAALRENLQKTINVEVDADTAAADAELETTTALVDRLDHKRVSIGRIFGGGGGIGNLLSQIGGLGDSFKGLASNITEGSVVWTGMISSIIALAPLAVAALAPLVGIAGALITGFAGAVASIGGLAIVAIPLLTKLTTDYQKLQAARQQAETATTGAQRAAALQAEARATANLTGSERGLFGMLSQIMNLYHRLQAEFARPLANALKPWFDIAKTFIGLLPLIVRPALGAFKTLGEVILPIVRSPEFKSFIKELGTFGAFAFQQFALAGIALAHAFVELFIAFMPLARVVLPGLVTLAREFATWASGLAQSKGFQAFIKYVTDNAPMLGHLLLNLLIIFVKLGVALAPLGQLMLVFLTWLTKILSKLTPNELLLIVVAVTALGAALAAAFEAVPLLIAGVVAGIVALAALIVNFWPKIKGAWNAGLKYIKDSWDATWRDAKLIFDIFKNYVELIWNAIVMSALTDVRKIVNIFAAIPGPLGAPFRKARAAIDGELGRMEASSKATTARIQADFDRLHGKTVNLTVSGHGIFAQSAARSNSSTNPFLHPKGAKRGLMVPGRDTGVDSQLILARPGELVVPTEMVGAGLVDHLRGMIPGFQGGGIIPRYGPGPVRGLRPWEQHNVNAMEAIETHAMGQTWEKQWRAIINEMRSAAAAFRDTGARSGSAAIAQSFARSVLPRGWSFPALLSLWNQESGWNAYAVNPSSGAYGIPQSLGHGHPYNLGDYKAQVLWGINYIAGRYGSSQAAWAHEVAFNWYDKGGPLPPGATMAINRTGGTEEILTPAERRAFVSLAKGSGEAPRMDDLLDAVGELIDAVNRVAPGVGDALNRTARHAGQSAYYATR